MGCAGCDKQNNNYTFFDRHGNKVNAPDKVRKVSSKEVVESVLSYDGTPLIKKSIDQILDDKKERRRLLNQQSQELIDNMTDDMKRAAILDLIDVYNCEEFMMTYTSPNQALVALYNYVHNQAFEKIIKEFDGLAEEVDLRYNELQSKKIKVRWNR